MFRRRRGLVVAAALLAVGACGRAEKRAAEGDADAQARAQARAGTGTGTGTGTGETREPKEAGASDGEAARGEAAYLNASVRAAQSIGHTSIVFKIDLSNGKRAAFKPASRRGPVRYKGEIAARRLAVALGIPNVPPALLRSFDATSLSVAKGADEMLVHGGVVKGALMPWIDGLAFIALEKAPLEAQWKQWLRRGEAIPDDQRELARQISTLVAFDYVTANWDRWSGGNVGIDKASGTLLFIDNDGAFFEVPPPTGLARNERLLRGVDKFSRSFVARLRQLDEGAMARALGEEGPGVPLLSSKALAGVLERRKQALEMIDAKAQSAGDDPTFVFP